MNYRAMRWRGANRIACAIAALMVNALIGYAFIVGLRNVPLLRALADNSPLILIDLKPPTPEKPDVERPVQPRPKKEQSAGSPSSAPKVEKPDQLPPPPKIAPPPIIALPNPIVPAPASSVAGEGTGAGGGGGTGSGEGLGRGGSGNGSGAGNGGEFSPARQTGGSFRNSDLPSSAREAGRLKIGVRYAVGPAGRVDQCEIIESSGYGEVDAMTCRVIVERYRFRPARDPDGYAVTEVREEDYRWRQGRVR